MFPTRLDRIALTISSIAFTTMRRVGTFLPDTRKNAKDFSQIEARYIRYFDDTNTMFIWIPKHKTDPKGRGLVLTLKPTGDDCCPIRLTREFVHLYPQGGPIFVTPTRLPLQSWLLK